MAPVLGHVASSQQFLDEKDQNYYFFNRESKSQHFKI